MFHGQPLLLAALAAGLTVPHWEVTLVNQERQVAPRDGRLALCQAIPAVTIAPVLRPERSARRRVAVRLSGPDGTRAVRRETLRGRRAVPFPPSALGLDAFVEGTYRVRVTRGSRTLARASLRLVGTGRC